MLSKALNQLSAILQIPQNYSIHGTLLVSK